MANDARVNGAITEQVVQLISIDGQMQGDTPIDKARSIADDNNLDLVEVVPARNGSLAICKLLDYGKFCYQRSKKEKHQKHSSVKEVRIKCNISDYDLERKCKQVSDFLKKQHKVLYKLEMKGRRQNNGALDKFNASLSLFADIASWQEPNVSDRFVSVMLQPSG